MSTGAGKTWRYRFSEPGGEEIEVAELENDAAAEAHARALSKDRVVPVIMQRHDLVDWEYIGEVDDRP